MLESTDHFSLDTPNDVIVGADYFVDAPDEIVEPLETTRTDAGNVVSGIQFDVHGFRRIEWGRNIDKRPARHAENDPKAFSLQMHSHTVANILVHNLGNESVRDLYRQLTGIDVDSITLSKPADPLGEGFIPKQKLQQYVFDTQGFWPMPEAYDEVNAGGISTPYVLRPPAWPDEAVAAEQSKKEPWRPKTQTMDDKYKNRFGRRFGQIDVQEDR